MSVTNNAMGDEARAALADMPDGASPDGNPAIRFWNRHQVLLRDLLTKAASDDWVFVPREPTPKMVDALCVVFTGTVRQKARARYAKMIEQAEKDKV